MGSDIGLNENGLLLTFGIEIYLSGDGILYFDGRSTKASNNIFRFRSTPNRIWYSIHQKGGLKMKGEVLMVNKKPIGVLLDGDIGEIVNFIMSLEKED